MNKNELVAEIKRHGDTQAALADAIGVSLTRLNAKINGTAGAEFTRDEMQGIIERYGLSPERVNTIFFS